jgi:hypothetical protein
MHRALHNLFSLPDVMKVMTSRRVTKTGHVTCKEEMRNAYRILIG